MVNYYELGGDKRLNQIVFAGSHDAGITSGAANIKTQQLNILGQAIAGSRIFDLRIAAAKVNTPPGQTKRVEMRAYHDAGAFHEQNKVRDIGFGPTNVTRTQMSTMGIKHKVSGRVGSGLGLGKVGLGGDWGMGLEGMLQQAYDFVTNYNPTEFLILKFDKCTNWSVIAEACINCLGDTIYTDGGNLNNKTLRELAGKVIVLFGPAGVREASRPYGVRQNGFQWHDGILGFKNLQDGTSTYDENFNGLQYYGKGGTSVGKFFKKKKQNIKKQTTLIDGAINLRNPEVMPMMYWTTTGLFESIKKRNKGMWDPPNIQKMRNLWSHGMREIVEYRNPLAMPQGSPHIGPTRKRYMVNMVMIDFADTTKCQIIRDLNDALPDHWAQMDDDDDD